MTLGSLAIKKVRKHFEHSHAGINSPPFAARKTTAPLSGKALAARLKGLLSRKAALQLDHHITGSCEQIDD